MDGWMDTDKPTKDVFVSLIFFLGGSRLDRALVFWRIPLSISSDLMGGLRKLCDPLNKNEDKKADNKFAFVYDFTNHRHHSFITFVDANMSFLIIKLYWCPRPYL